MHSGKLFVFETKQVPDVPHLPLGNANPGGFFQTRVYGFDGLQTRVPGYPGLIMSVRRAAAMYCRPTISGHVMHLSGVRDKTLRAVDCKLLKLRATDG